MKFIWDENKRQINLKKHGLDFEDARHVFQDEYAVSELDCRYLDDRWQIVGKLENKVIVLIAYLAPNPELYRILSMRLATKREANFYEWQKIYSQL